MKNNYWEERYLNNDTGWDAGQITTPIKAYIDQLENKNLKILIPGAGNGYEFDYLIQNGFTNVTVIDIASFPIQNIKKRNPKYEDQLIVTDFFDFNDSYDLIIEQTFFCAINPDLRKKYVTKMTDLLNTKGKIIGLLFDFPLTEAGPPFGGSKEEYLNLFSNDFKLKTLEKAYNSILPRKDKELFFIFEKK
jgi:methyl halide transferase